jgi:hypothetical protein
MKFCILKTEICVKVSVLFCLVSRQNYIPVPIRVVLSSAIYKYGHSFLSVAKAWLVGCLKEGSPKWQDESSKQKDESQQIAAWKLLYRVQHPAWYVSRLQTIPSPDTEL